MEIVLMCVGKIKENYLVAGIEHYLKEIRRVMSIKVIQIDDEKTPESLSLALEQQVKEKEGNQILQHIREEMYVITLEINGHELGPDGFVQIVNKWKRSNKSTLCFIIGGSLGLSEKVIKRSNYAISFSKMTFPHQLMRLVLVEQIAKGITCDKVDLN